MGEKFCKHPSTNEEHGFEQDQASAGKSYEQIHKQCSHEPTRNWTDSNPDEIRAWIGMTFLMGIHQLPDLDSYWSYNPALIVPVVAKVMPCKHYKKIQETVHLNDNLTAAARDCSDFGKLHKVRPLVDK